ncbi:Plastidal glycolate/glycerate translocator 1, chloroplastic [Zea mays]|uniref:Plastidal glycolate/glycerate translocator 1, chloroplastic n=1 Tax=Zea mays TaxID=4577 RepID=A0A317YDC1_MAIZE|nr:Plastidal glycolate/glycerate translocator 1, chloroplastic [Zea mays]
MAATAMIRITTLRCRHDPLSSLPRTTSAACSCTLPPRCRQCRLLPPHSSGCSPSSSIFPRRVRVRPTAALKRIGGGNTSFMGPANNGATTLQRSSSPDLRRSLIVLKSTAGTGGGNASSGLLPTILGVAHLLVSLGIVLATDKFLKQAFVAASIKFPSALFGMFCVFSVLVVFDTFVPALAKAFMDFFEPATLFIQRWLPLFYVPSLVVLPLAVRDVPAASGVKIFAITFGGWFATLAVAGYTALAVRKLVKTQLIPAEPMSKASPFSTVETWACMGCCIRCIVRCCMFQSQSSWYHSKNMPSLSARCHCAGIHGWLPSGVKKVLHPIITCALSADLAAVAYGYLSGSGLDAVLGDYLTKAPSNPGAGDVLMGFLGSVIISFAFSMFKQRKLVKRHAAEIFTSIAIASTFSLYSTAVIGRLIGLEPSLTISILPRCITVALALSIVSFFEGVNSSLTAAVVVVTGLIGANFVQVAMDKLGLNDPIARGIGTASSAHGLGTAALSAKEPEALPFCAIAYGLTGIFGSLVCSVPVVRQSLVFIAG